MAKKRTKKQIEKYEAWMRVPVGIVSGIIIYIWGYLIALFALLNFINTIFSGKRLKEMAKMSETWLTQIYYFGRYITFNSNKRPFPFESLKEDFGKFE